MIKFPGTCNNARGKVLHYCSLQIFLFEVFDHTVEQYSNLLKTRAFITVTSWLRSRTRLTRLICARLDIQDDVAFRTWSSNVSCGSKTTPRSLAEDVMTITH